MQITIVIDIDKTTVSSQKRCNDANMLRRLAQIIQQERETTENICNLKDEPELTPVSKDNISHIDNWPIPKVEKPEEVFTDKTSLHSMSIFDRQVENGVQRGQRSNFGIVTTSDNLDSEGLPWDKRIHSRAKTIRVDGTWRVARSADPTMVEQIKKELKAAMQVGTMPPYVSEGIKQSQLHNHIVEGVNIPTPPASTKVPQPPIKITHIDETQHTESFLTDTPPATFVTVMRRITAAMTANKITRQGVIEILKSIDVRLVDPTIISQRQDLLPAIDVKLREAGI